MTAMAEKSLIDNAPSSPPLSSTPWSAGPPLAAGLPPGRPLSRGCAVPLEDARKGACADRHGQAAEEGNELPVDPLADLRKCVAAREVRCSPCLIPDASTIPWFFTPRKCDGHKFMGSAESGCRSVEGQGNTYASQAIASGS